MKQRKRRYQQCDYGHKRWQRGKTREKPVWKVAVVVYPTDDYTVRLLFRVPHSVLVTTVFNILQGSLFKSYTSEWVEQPNRLNGKCYRLMALTVHEPDLHRQSLPEWLPLIKSMMERRFRCQVTCFDNYEKFLNA